MHVTRQAVPMPAEVALALAGVALTAQEPRLALLIILGFTAFLRTGEITGLKVSQVQADPLSGQIILALPATKTSKRKMESVAGFDARLALFARFILSATSDTLVGGLNSNQFPAKLRLLLKFLRLESLNFSGYSLRHGGASHAAFATGTHFDSLLIQGRWQSVKTARQYLDSG